MKLEAKNPIGEMFISPYSKSVSGADPEMFVFDQGGQLLPAFEFLPHKSTPLIVKGPHWGITDQHFQNKIYWDGFQAEFSMEYVPQCLMFLNQYLQVGLHGIQAAAKAKSPTAKLSLKSVVRIPAQTLKTSMDPHVELGCQPSFNAYDQKGISVDNPRTLRYRFAGGHMHFGISELQDKHNAQVKAVKALDKIVGVWSVGAAKSFDNPIRRRYYGMAGEYRTPKHGLEYRVLSNFWMSHPVISHATWEIARRAVYLSLTPFDDLWVAPEEMVVECIQNSDTKIAKQLLRLNKPIFMWLFKSRGWTQPTIEKLFQVGIDGIESTIKDPEDVEGNWQKSIDPKLESSPQTWVGHSS